MRKYYKDLPSRIQEIALDNCPDVNKKLFKDGEISLSSSFSWDRSPQGHEFWENIYTGGDIPKVYLVNEDDLFNKAFRLISKVIKHGK